MYQKYFNDIGELHEKIKPKITEIEKILGIIFLQEIQFITDFEGNVKDVVLLLGDIEGFSYKSKIRSLALIKIFEKFFDFPAAKNLYVYMDDFLQEDFSRGLDQYHGVSLLSHQVVSYYAILGGIRPEFDSVNVNFYPSAIGRIQKKFPNFLKGENFRPLGSLYLEFSDNKISEETLYSYELHPFLFQELAREKCKQISFSEIRDYVEIFANLSINDYWGEYISWSGINIQTGEKSHLSEFFLKSKKRAQILQELSSIFRASQDLDAYICEVFEKQKIIKTWFLWKDSYKRRKNKGLYSHQYE